jgi:hypothetical protein
MTNSDYEDRGWPMALTLAAIALDLVNIVAVVLLLTCASMYFGIRPPLSLCSGVVLGAIVPTVLWFGSPVALGLSFFALWGRGRPWHSGSLLPVAVFWINLGATLLVLLVATLLMLLVKGKIAVGGFH